MRECAADALDNQVEYGIWGGMTERRRRALLKAHPEVVSWADYFKGEVSAASDRVPGDRQQMGRAIDSPTAFL
jgi:hypothetical protein